jgi:hypothetical protein
VVPVNSEISVDVTGGDETEGSTPQPTEERSTKIVKNGEKMRLLFFMKNRTSTDNIIKNIF